MIVEILTSFLALFSASFSFYYLLFAVRKPKIYCQEESNFSNFIKRRCPILEQHYWPTPWAVTAHLTTIFRAVIQRQATTNNWAYTRQIVVLSDGGQVALDWATWDVTAAEDAPVLLILPGLTGGSMNNYVTHMAQDGLLLGYKPVVFNQRGIADIPMKTPKTFCATSTRDLKDVVENIRKCQPKSPILTVGVSLGGMIISKYLHDYPLTNDISGVVTVCSTWDMHASRTALRSFTSKQLYNKYLARELKRLLMKNVKEFDTKQFKDVSLEKMQLIEDFDKEITIKMHGYSSLEEYYTDGSNYSRIPQLRTPLIAINTVDDPFVPYESLPFTNFKGNPLALLVVLRKGGHFGFIEGLYPTGPTWMNRALREVLPALNQYSLNKHS